jgi:hypothetical protein
LEDNMTGPYVSDPDDLGITHEYGEDVAVDVVSTFPFARGEHPGDGNPQAVIVRKPRP